MSPLPKPISRSMAKTSSSRRMSRPSTRLPLHNLENIVCFTWQGASPALMGACADRNIGLCFLTPNGRFQARVTGKVKGNVLLRKKQYEVSEKPDQSVPIAASFLLGKIANCRKVIERAIRDHALLVDVPALTQASACLKETLNAIPQCDSIGELMAFEGSAAKIYFGVFDQLILQQREDFTFQERSRRPPLDNMNSLLSFLYTLLTNEVASALETVGLDPYVGFLHQDRPGRPSLRSGFDGGTSPDLWRSAGAVAGQPQAGDWQRFHSKRKRRHPDGR